MKNKVFLFGAGGHSRSVISLLRDQGYDVLGIYDDAFDKAKEEFIHSVKILGKIENYNYPNKIILSIGDNHKREVIFRQKRDRIYMGNISHSRSFIDKSVILGRSNLIFGNTFINSNVEIADNNIINTGSIIEHEVIIGSNNHVSVGTIICGRSKIGDNCFLGAGSVINDSVSICNNVLIGSNSTVTRSIEEPGVYVGQPTRKINE
ncbi:NeuD/PglB/VioB family sugar acetyltransferase [Christiangramia salexigens]|uniref:PglD N-terminal domain-containing protein n=1 Tax=Christiangramia salexigens TaxID=1913577 RepID=A0A1L3J4P0_9FLAO|nr:NeuD/PglB/VioB family sugar acetyltransferase [Christiangramia salexigens]APG60119.1 hypothetical protein LPB144_06680 [Christiangramia salexigens]